MFSIVLMHIVCNVLRIFLGILVVSSIGIIVILIGIIAIIVIRIGIIAIIAMQCIVILIGIIVIRIGVIVILIVIFVVSKLHQCPSEIQVECLRIYDQYIPPLWVRLMLNCKINGTVHIFFS